MIPVETVPGTGREMMKKYSAGVNSCMIYFIHCKNLYKCYNVPQLSTTIKKKEMKEKKKILINRKIKFVKTFIRIT
jgi:hypothetical protein